MKRNLNTTIPGIDGVTPLSQQVKDEATGNVTNQPIQASTAVVVALLNVYQGETLSADQKIQRANIAQKVFDATAKEATDSVDAQEGTMVELSLDEVSVIKHVVGLNYAPLMVQRLMAIIEG